uniref:Uncharacterized protein n=1 Tax=Glossina palpalis gambiensis TaxID=67801 RepID=A0A1B0BUU3_9MUSC
MLYEYPSHGPVWKNIFFLYFLEYQAFCFGFKSCIVLLWIAILMVMRYRLYSTYMYIRITSVRLYRATTIQFEVAFGAAFSIVCEYKQVLSTNIAVALQHNATQSVSR